MEPKIEPQVSEYLTDPLALAVLFHATYERLAPNSGYETRKETRIFDPESSNGKLMLATCAQVQKAILSERVPSSPAPRLEFQADRMTETEWSADTWLVLPSGKREVLGWIPCDSQEEADENVATLKKLYAEAVPSSPVAQKRTLVQQNLVIAAEIHCAMTDQEFIPFEGKRYFPALSTQKLERILGFHAPPDESIVVQLLRTELLQYSEEVKHLREQLDSPAAPLDEKELIDKFERAAPPTIAEALREHWLSMIECLHDSGTDKAHCACGVWVSKPQPNVGEAVNRWIEHVFRSVGLTVPSSSPSTRQEARKTSESSSRTDVPLQSGIPEKVEQTGSKCSMASPCGEIVANAKYEYKLPSAESGSITVDTQTGKGSGSQQACNLQSTSGVPDPKIPCCDKREIVAKGVCGVDSVLHPKDKYAGACPDWHHTHNVCLGCGREEGI